MMVDTVIVIDHRTIDCYNRSINFHFFFFSRKDNYILIIQHHLNYIDLASSKKNQKNQIKQWGKRNRGQIRIEFLTSHLRHDEYSEREREKRLK